MISNLTFTHYTTYILTQKLFEHESFFGHKCTYSIYYVLYGFPFTNLKHKYPQKRNRTHKITHSSKQHISLTPLWKALHNSYSFSAELPADECFWFTNFSTSCMLDRMINILLNVIF